MDLLSDEELKRLTGAKHSARQEDVLNANGIYFIKRMDGSIVTTWHHVNHPAKRQAKNDSGPNFGAIGNG